MTTVGRWFAAALLLASAACARKGSSPSGDGGVTALPPISSWTLADLGPGRCIGVNDNGQVLGTDDSGAGFIASGAQARIALGAGPSNTVASPTAIAPSGDVVGYGVNPTAPARLALLYTHGAWSVLAAGGDWSVATGIDGQGDIVGTNGSASAQAMQGFRLSGGAPVDLGLKAPNSSASFVQGDRVAGIFQTASGATHAFVKVDGSDLVDLGTLGGGDSGPFAMDSAGDVVGAAETASGVRHAFVARFGQAMVDLGVPEGGVSSEARGISSAGQIAGNSYDAQQVSHPVVFVPGGTPVDLMASVPTRAQYFSVHVVGMSPDGKIVGWALSTSADAGSGTRCLLWTGS